MNLIKKIARLFCRKPGDKKTGRLIMHISCPECDGDNLIEKHNKSLKGKRIAR